MITSPIDGVKHSMASSLSRRAWLRKLAVPLVVLAIIIWGIVLFWQRNGSDVQRHIETGMALARDGKGIKAEREWREAARLAPNNADVWELLGEYYLSGKAYSRALDAYRQLARLRPNTPDLNAHLGLCAFRSGDGPAALQYAEVQLKHDPNDTQALALAVTVLASMGEQQKRLEYLRRLVKLTPDDLDYVTLLAKTLAFKSAYGEALPFLDHVLQLDPKNPEAWALHGLCRMNTDVTPAGQASAEADLKQATALSPLISSPRMNLGILYRRQGKAAEAIVELEAAADVSPELPAIRFELARAYDQTGQKARADMARRQFEVLQQAADEEFRLRQRSAIDEGNFDIKMRLAQIYLKRHDLSKALFYLNAAQKLRPDAPNVKAGYQEFSRLAGGSTPPTADSSAKPVVTP